MPEVVRSAGESTQTRERNELKRPSMYKVLLHNDHFTTMEFVVDILESIFHKTPVEAVQIMLRVHRQGLGLCGVYPREIAETKVVTVHKVAEDHGFPLKCSMERE